jgi:hypothetical protein
VSSGAQNPGRHLRGLRGRAVAPRHHRVGSRGVGPYARRCLSAAAVMLPAGSLTFSLGQPFAVSAIASTAAIVLHAPERIRNSPVLIARCYAVGTGVSGVLSMAGLLIGAPALMVSCFGAAVIIGTQAARIHPPTACIPLAISSDSRDAVELLGRWLAFTLVAVMCLAALWVITGNRRDPIEGSRV